MARHYNFEEIENFRDLGGYETQYGETAFGVIFRSGDLSEGTANDLKKIQSLGVKSVIDFRTPENCSERPDCTFGVPGIKTYQICVNGAGRIPKDFDDTIESYMEMFENPANSKQILETIADCEKPCIIHCTAGKDRTGAYSLLLLWAAGVSFNDICADYMITYPLLPKLYSKAFKDGKPLLPLCVIEPNVNFLPKVIDEFKKRYVSPIEYFNFIGLSDDKIATLCNLLHKQEKSCGAVVFHDGKILIEHMAGGHYSIPKGHVEAGDDGEKGTALREIKEETNLDVEIQGDDSYFIYYSPFPGCVKKVVFFRAVASNINTIAQECEVSSISWMTPDEAIETVTHQSDKDVIKWAINR